MDQTQLLDLLANTLGGFIWAIGYLITILIGAVIASHLIAERPLGWLNLFGLFISLIIISGLFATFILQLDEAPIKDHLLPMTVEIFGQMLVGVLIREWTDLKVLVMSIFGDQTDRST